MQELDLGRCLDRIGFDIGAVFERASSRSEAQAMVARLFANTAGWVVAMGAVLFGAAGTVRWPAGWAFLAEMSVLAIGSGLWLARRDPALLAERLSLFVQRGQSRWDQIFIVCAGLVWIAWLVLMGLDAQRFHESAVPSWLQGLGGAGLAVSIVLVCFVFRENTFASPVIKIQRERGHHVIDTGPYAHVRHPMYSSAILYLACMALLLGSWRGRRVKAAPAAHHQTYGINR